MINNKYTNFALCKFVFLIIPIEMFFFGGWNELSAQLCHVWAIVVSKHLLSVLKPRKITNSERYGALQINCIFFLKTKSYFAKTAEMVNGACKEARFANLQLF